MTRVYRQANAAHVWFGLFDHNKYCQELDSDGKYTSLPSMTPEKWKLYQQEGSTSLIYLFKQEGFKCLSQHEAEAFTAQCQADIFLHSLAMLDEMAKGDHLYTYPVVTSVPHSDRTRRYTFQKSWLAVMDCIRWLVTQTWWSRVWTLQEASLPRVDPIVHAPPYSFKLSRLLDGVGSMWHHNNNICCKWFGQPVITSNRYDGEFGAAYTQCRAVHGQRRVLAEIAQDDLSMPLEMVVSATQGRRATEIRDHWFGIFGFLPQMWQAQSKAFSKHETTAELFAQCSNLLYLDSASLTLLDKARRCKQSSVVDLPSWAIDLSNPRTSNEEDGHRWRLYGACGKTTYDRTTDWPELREPWLSVKAIRVSTVQACAERILPLCHTSEDLCVLVNAWLTLYRDNANPFDSDAFWRAALMDRNVQRHWLHEHSGPLSTNGLKDVKRWWIAWNGTGDHRDLTVDRKAGGTKRGRFHYKELQMNAEKTRFFVTSQGLPGMGPHDMQPGDEIYAVAGCRALVILRPSLEKDVQRPTVVGLCFVDRWMYGRATQGGAAWRTMKLY